MYPKSLYLKRDTDNETITNYISFYREYIEYENN